MNTLTYTYTAPNGETKEIKSYKEVQALVNAQGGHYKATFAPVFETVNISPAQLARRVKVVAK